MYINFINTPGRSIMKKTIVLLITLSFLNLSAGEKITKKTIKKWINRCHAESVKRFGGMPANSGQALVLKNSISDSYFEWYEGYLAIKKGKKADMWKFRTGNMRDSLKMKCPETAMELPDLSE
jgi:hypothetical protein